MGITRNLTSAEILDQVVQVGQILAAEGRRLSNIVFMGMGEPLHNFSGVTAAVDSLIDPGRFDRPGSRVLVSTVGVADRLVTFAKDFPTVSLALSLHSAVAETRQQLIPLAAKYPLDRLRDCLRQIHEVTGRQVMIEYLMLDGINDSKSDANALTRWLGEGNFHVNLIPYNEIDEAPHLKGSSPGVIQAFADRIKAAGYKTTIRYSLGGDIAAACGQLVRRG